MEEIFKSIQENERNRISNIVNSFSDSIEKAVIRHEGDIHPNGKWVWKKTPSGYDWRNISSNKSNSKEDEVLKRAKQIGVNTQRFNLNIYQETRELSEANPELSRKIEEAAYQGVDEYGEKQIRVLKLLDSKFLDLMDSLKESEDKTYYKTKTLQALSKKFKLEKYEKKFKALDTLIDAETADRTDHYNIPNDIHRYYDTQKDNLAYEIRYKFGSYVERYIIRNYIK